MSALERSQADGASGDGASVATPDAQLPAGKELDALVAEKVMGWKRMTEAEVHPGQRFNEVYPHAASAGFGPARISHWWFDAVAREQNGDAVAREPAEEIIEYDYQLPRFAPSTDISAAWQVVARMKATGWHYECGGSDDGHDYALFYLWTEDGKCFDEYADTASLAICRAALKAVA